MRDEARRVGAVFAAAFVLFLCFFAGHYVMGDHVPRMAWARALLEKGTSDISSYVPDTHYSIYGVGQTLLHVPFLWLSSSIRAVTGIRCEGPLNMLVYVLNAALGVAILYVLLRRYRMTPRDAAARAVAIGAGTPWIAYSKLEYGESLVATCLLAVWALLPGLPFLAGLAAGAAITVRNEAWLWVPLTLWAARVPREKAGRLALGMLPGLLVFAWGNWARWGSPFSTGYHESQFTTPFLVGLHGLLFSSGKSLFLYAPVLLALPLALARGGTSPDSRRLALWTGALFATHLFLYAMWCDWSGDDCWGVRYLILPTLAGALVVAQSREIRREVFYALCAAGLLVQLPALLVGPHTTLLLGHELKPARHNGAAGKSVIDLEDVRFNPRFSPIVTSAELLRLKLFGARAEHTVEGRDWSWTSSFDPPLSAADVAWDVLWLHRPGPKQDVGLR